MRFAGSPPVAFSFIYTRDMIMSHVNIPSGMGPTGPCPEYFMNLLSLFHSEATLISHTRQSIYKDLWHSQLRDII